jgi:foldase protein PrsA
VSAVVNGRPVFTWQLNSVMVNRFGKQTLEGIITEQLIYQQANKEGISVTQAEVQAREDEMVKSIGTNVKLEDLLKYQGLTKSDFDNQIKLQMIVEKILGKDVAFTDAQLDNFVATNSAVLTATDSASKREEARLMLTEQEINTKITGWLQDLKDKAKIIRFL